MMRERGIKASELIQQLQKLMEEHGDREVICYGGDYPGGCHGVWYVTEQMSDGYMPAGTFVVN